MFSFFKLVITSPQQEGFDFIDRSVNKMRADVIIGNTIYDLKIKPYLDKITSLRCLGHTQAEVAKILDINVNTFSVYLKKYPDLYNAWRDGEAIIAEKLMDTALQEAYGYKYTEEKKEEFYDADGNITGSKVVTTEKFARPNPTILTKCCESIEPERWVNHDKEEKDITITLADELIEYSE